MKSEGWDGCMRYEEGFGGAIESAGYCFEQDFGY